MSRKRTFITGGILLLAAAFCGAALSQLYASSGKSTASAEKLHAVIQSNQPIVAAPEADRLSAAFEQVATSIRPTVVSISSTHEIKASAGMEVPWDSPLRHFFGDDFFDHFFAPQSPRHGFVQQGLGTGFIVSDDGYLLTNHHVVSDADEVRIQLDDQSTHTAKVVGSDSRTDLAVLKIDVKNLKPSRLGDSDQLRVGDWVVAVGNPFGLSSTITAGIVSAKGRSRMGIADYEDFIQTDAAINPGNSGGPLVNLRGEVVGINTAIFSRSGGYMGIGFAIPVNMAKSIMKSLIENGRVSRGLLGVEIQDLTEDLAASFGYGSTSGALVSGVSPHGPADKAGIKPGDIVSQYNGEPINGTDDLRLKVAATRPHTRVDVAVFRDGDVKSFKVTLGELESKAMASAKISAASDEIGATVRTLTPELAEQAGVEATLRGAVVVEVDPMSPAAHAGLKPGDVIVRVQNVEVRDAAGLRHELARHDLTRGVRLTVRDGHGQRFVFLKKDGRQH